MKKKIYEFTRTWSGRLAMGVLAAGMLAACSDSDDKITYDLPSLSDINNAVPGEEYTRTGKATATWTVSSNATNWCTVSPATGNAGDFTLTISVTDTDWNFVDNNEATITFAYSGTDNTTSFKVVRPAKVPEIRFSYDGEDDDAITEFVITENSSLNYSRGLKVEANFDWVLNVNSAPSWLAGSSLFAGSAPISGKAGVPKNWNLAPNYDELDTEGLTGTLTFDLDESTLQRSFTLPVRVGTIGDDYLKVTTKPSMTIFPSATSEGLFTEEDGGMDRVDFGVTAVNADLEVYSIEYSYASDYSAPEYLDAIANWLKVERTPTRAALTEYFYTATLDANLGKGRAAELFILPRSVRDGISNPLDMVGSDGKLKPEYERYKVISVKQGGTDPMILLSTSTAYHTVREFYPATEKGEFTEEQLLETYQTDNVYILVADNIGEEENVSYQINFPQFVVTGRWGQFVTPRTTGDENAIKSVSPSAPFGQQAGFFLYPRYNETGVAREASVTADFTDEEVYPTVKSRMGAVIFRQNP